RGEKVREATQADRSSVPALRLPLGSVGKPDDREEGGAGRRQREHDREDSSRPGVLHSSEGELPGAGADDVVEGDRDEGQGELGVASAGPRRRVSGPPSRAAPPRRGRRAPSPGRPPPGRPRARPPRGPGGPPPRSSSPGRRRGSSRSRRYFPIRGAISARDP